MPLQEMTVKALRALARDLQIPGRSKMNKAELVEAIEATKVAAGAPEEPVEPDEAEPAAIIEAEAAEAPAPSASTSAVAPEVEPAEPPTAEPPAAQPVRRSAAARPPRSRPQRSHPHADATPLLPPLDLGELPETYDRAALRALPRDPRTLMCAWSLDGATREGLGTQTVELRVYDRTRGERLARTATPSPGTWRYVLTGLTPDRRYQAVLGVLTQGRFQPVLRSAPVALPPDRPSDLVDPVRVRLDPEAPPQPPVDLRAEAGFHRVEVAAAPQASLHDHARALARAAPGPAVKPLPSSHSLLKREG
ncbi:MAG: DUF4912 domain-containing protein [Alphaproteobacteria bacterium]|nr:DUF4912 domain-containing protein [Alphaproteobacteria bacterium]